MNTAASDDEREAHADDGVEPHESATAREPGADQESAPPAPKRQRFRWLKPSAPDLETFVKWLFKVGIMLAVVVMTWRFVLAADPTTPPWEALPILNRL